MTQTKMGRARTIEEFGARMGVFAELERPNFKPYEPQDGDVFITPWAKSGTTMMQQMFHQLRTGGDEDYDDISRVVPWEDTAVMCDFDMTAPQRAAPRGFKSHREYERLPAGMRYVITLRDPHESYVSLYRFFNGWQIERDAISLEDFMPFWLGGGPGGTDYMTHLLSWYARRHEPDTLLMNYRTAAKNRPETIRRLAGFIGVELSHELAALVEHRTSREYMHQHRDKFDDAMVARQLDEVCGIPFDSDSSKVQSEGSKSSSLPESVVAAVDAMWAERVEPATGHADFASLAAEVDALSEQ